MTKQEMLNKVGLTDQQHKDLWNKFGKFFNGLDPAQQKVIKNHMPTNDKIAASFGPGVTAEHLRTLNNDELAASNSAFVGFMADNG